MQALILILHVLTAIAIIVLVLLQHGKGADVGAAFGSGASNTMFGSASALPFMVKLTGILAAIFFATSITLSHLAANHVRQQMTVLQLPTTSEGSNLKIPQSDKSKKELDEGFSFVPEQGNEKA